MLIITTGWLGLCLIGSEIVGKFPPCQFTRLKYQKRVGAGVQIRIPFADSVLVLDIREKVREFKAERMLTLHI
jgi:hypothetical protein